MGAMKLMLLVLFTFISPLSFADHIASNNTEKSLIDDFGAYVRMGNTEVVSDSKFAHAGARGGVGAGGGGHSTRGSSGNGGESGSSQRRGGGGGAVIPVYAAAGAASKPNNHHNAANSHNWCWKDKALIVIASGFTSFLLHIYI